MLIMNNLISYYKGIFYSALKKKSIFIYIYIFR